MFGALTASAQEKSAPPEPAAAPQPEPYQPGLGEYMALQQMRHIKLWYAGRGGNWPLAALQKAIDGKDSAAFAAAFDNLSAGCNACHHALDHGFIAIGRPASLPYSDQSFTPPK